MSKQEEIKQALAAATPGHESMHNQHPYFTNKQLEELSEYFKTIPVDEEGHPYEPEYNSMAVRSDVLKMISDIWQARRKQYEVEFERDRLRKELEEERKTKEKMINRDDLLVWLGDLLRDKDIEIARASHRLAREAATDEAKLIKTIIRNVEVQPYFVGRLGEGSQDAD